MKKYFRFVVVFACLAFARNALAGPVVVGVEWFQPRELGYSTMPYTWNDFNVTCPAGVCSGQLGGSGPDLSGWTWASADEVNTLFNFFIQSTEGVSPLGPGPSLYYDPSASFANAAMDVFDNNVPSFSPSSEFVRGAEGWVRDAVPSGENMAYYASISYGWFELDHWQIASTQQEVVKSVRRSGAWLYRSPIEVPAPSALVLAIVALLALRLNLKRRG